MVLKKDQERIKILLKDTITLLCKNGLTFKNEFSIEATIGITLDQDEVLLVSINEIIQSELNKAKLASVTQDEAENGRLGAESDEQQSSSPSSTSKHHRKRRRSKVAIQDVDYDDGESYEEDDFTQLSVSNHPEPPPKKAQRIKQEGSDAEDLVFVKQEMDADWSAITSESHTGLGNQGDRQESGAYTGDVGQENLDFLQGASLEPVSTHGGHLGTNVSQNTGLMSAESLPGPSQSQMVDSSRPLQLVTSRPAQSLPTPVQDEAKPLMLTSKAPSMPSPGLVVSSLGQVLVQSSPLQAPSMAHNFVMLSPALLGSGLSQSLALMSQLPIARNLNVVPPAAKSLLTAANANVCVPPLNLTTSQTPVNLSKTVANLTVTSPSIRGPRLANDRPLSSSPDSFKSFGKIGKVRRSSSSSSTSTMDPPLASPSVKSVRQYKPSRRSSVDVMVLKLNDTQEREIITFVNNMASLGYKVDVKEICKMAHEMIFPKRQYKKMDVGHIKTFGPDWWREFLARHPELEEKDGHVLPCSAPKSV